VLSVAGFGEWYRSVLHEHVLRGGEDSLRVGYELGREAVAQGFTLLDLVDVHNDAVLTEMRRGIVDSEDVARLGGHFLLESVSAYEMVRRALQEAREVASLQRSQLEMLRQLSNFLADTSLASNSPGAFDEVLRLIAEHSCELIGAQFCVVAVSGYGDPLRASCYVSHETSGPEGDRPLGSAVLPASEPNLRATLGSLDGREIGSIEVFGKDDFSPADHSALIHVAQIVSAALERLRMHVGWQGD
jgi:hypothetical protein